MPSLTQQDDVHVLRLDETENRFSPEWMAQMTELLDEVVADPKPLVIAGTGKFYSNGLDLDWLTENGDRFDEYVGTVHALYAKILTLPVPTATAVNGHAFGAGAMLALACDWRVMRSDRGFFCLPEVDIRIPFTTGMAALIQSKLSARAAVDAMTTGARFSGPDALAAGIVDGTAEEDGLLAAAIARVSHLQGKDPKTLGAIKATMFVAAVSALSGS